MEPLTPTSPATSPAVLQTSPVASPEASSPSSPTAPTAAGPSSSLSSRRSTRSGRSALSLSLDLSDLPLPMHNHKRPPTPTNTLLFTNLLDDDVFRPENLLTLRDLVEQTAPLHSWAPLKSFSRIVASFFSAHDAAAVRAVWSGERIFGHVCQVYYGRHTPLLDAETIAENQHLALPDAGKLFFISPPPSPPHDWQSRREGAPNKQTFHADDLAEALAKLHHQTDPDQSNVSTSTPGPSSSTAPAATFTPKRRSRSSTLLYEGTPNLPAIAVEEPEDDFQDDDNNNNDDHHMDNASDAASDERMAVDVVPSLPETSTIRAHTARPPVELMNDA